MVGVVAVGVVLVIVVHVAVAIRLVVWLLSLLKFFVAAIFIDFCTTMLIISFIYTFDRSEFNFNS